MRLSEKNRQFYFFIKSFIKIADAITPIVTLGFYWTNFEYQFVKWNIEKKHKK